MTANQLTQAQKQTVANACTSIGSPMTVNTVDAALNGATIAQNGSCTNGSQCEAGETNIGNDGGIVIGNHNTIHQGDSTTQTSSSATANTTNGPAGNTASSASQHNSGSGSSGSTNC